MSIEGKYILVTGSARRVGKTLALAIARAGGNVIVHHGHSSEAAEETQNEIHAIGTEAYILQADLEDPNQVASLIKRASDIGPLYGLVNNAAIFEPLSWDQTDQAAWEKHISINLTAPFILSQGFARSLEPGDTGRIVNILDWKALRPGADHFPYTISKAALAAMTRSLAVAFAPQINVNGIALGAVLPPSDGSKAENILKFIPSTRWAYPEEVGESLIFLLEGPAYITGEVIHLDGGRHLI